MNNLEVLSRKMQLDNLFTKVVTFQDDMEMQSHWARYLCVLVSGFLETSVSTIFTKYAQDKSAPNVANYVARKLDRFQNPRMSKIIELTYSFCSDWGTLLERDTAGELKNAVDSIYANRCAIAHGQHSGITYVRIREWYRHAVRLVELLEKQTEK